MRTKISLLGAALLAAGAVNADSGHHGTRTYEVTITNITPGQTFTPILAATHKNSVRLFKLGAPASEELAILAESGDTLPLSDLLTSMPRRVLDTSGTGDLLHPGKTMSFKIKANSRFDRLSFAGMLIPTNDTFVAINSVRLPRKHTVFSAKAYDAGSEVDDELCANIPGPFCMGAGPSDENGEGYVHIGNGIHDIGDLDAAEYDWRNPVARVSVVRVH